LLQAPCPPLPPSQSSSLGKGARKEKEGQEVTKVESFLDYKIITSLPSLPKTPNRGSPFQKWNCSFAPKNTLSTSPFGVWAISRMQAAGQRRGVLSVASGVFLAVACALFLAISVYQNDAESNVRVAHPIMPKSLHPLQRPAMGGGERQTARPFPVPLWSRRQPIRQLCRTHATQRLDSVAANATFRPPFPQISARICCCWYSPLPPFCSSLFPLPSSIFPCPSPFRLVPSLFLPYHSRF
jgi:hypothetical protein